nr:MAG TPA: hypothetical protein [Bacteriophage sp.]
MYGRSLSIRRRMNAYEKSKKVKRKSQEKTRNV